MNCPLCGNTYPCVHNRRSAGTFLESGNNHFESTHHKNTSHEVAAQDSPYGTIAVDLSTNQVLDTAHEKELWRNQVASRVQQHRARRKNTDPDPNLELRFPVQEAQVDPRVMRARRFVAQAATRSPFAEDKFGPGLSSGAGQPAPSTAEDVTLAAAPNLIRFPRTSGGQDASRNSLATVHDYHAAMEALEAEASVPNALRITHAEEEASTETELPAAELSNSDEHFPPGTYPSIAYVPDEAPPIVYRAPKGPPAEQLELPNFDDIQLEATHQQVMPDLELGPQPAALGQRMMAGVVDAVIVLAAAAVFNLTFTQLAEENPHSRMALLCAVAVGGVLWTLYQYTFLVHGHGTPGMHLAQLELANFDGKPVSAFDRRCRAVASALSGFSLGLGFLWALVDEDQLGWHDRMTKTLIKSTADHRAVSRETVW